MKIEFPKNTRIIDCLSLNFVSKDIIYLKSFEDFLYLMGTFATVYKLDKCYYNISSEVIFIYEDN